MKGGWERRTNRKLKELLYNKLANAEMIVPYTNPRANISKESSV